MEDEEVEGNGGLKVEEIRSSCDDHEMTRFVWKSVWILVVTLSLVSCSVSPRRRNTKTQYQEFFEHD